MSTLTRIERRHLEGFFIQQGYVLGYSDKTFGEFFEDHWIDIHGAGYRTYGTSKGNKLRAFWDQTEDSVVGEVLAAMLEDQESYIAGKGLVIPYRVREAIARLGGKPNQQKSSVTDAEFLNREFAVPNVQKLPIEATIIPVVESRLDEARKALNAGAYLSVIFLCGSVLEAVLLGAAQKEPARFGRASAAPKAKDGSVLQIHDWKLTQLIDVSSELGILNPDDKKFSHGLRDFRNYIHPYQQITSGFTPDEKTAKICFHVLKAALASVAGER